MVQQRYILGKKSRSKKTPFEMVAEANFTELQRGETITFTSSKNPTIRFSEASEYLLYDYVNKYSIKIGLQKAVFIKSQWNLSYLRDN